MDVTDTLKIEIAVGNSRKARLWRNMSYTWAELVRRCSTPVRTSETMAEYLAADRAAQGSIKDVGGFVGGRLTGGRRRAACVAYRSVVTLDADYMTPDAGDMAALAEAAFPGCAFLIYSTHKHTPQKPRLRIVAPLSRNVSPEEYMALSRRVAERIGLKFFDHTTYEPSRLMYWPSVCADGVYYFRRTDGAPLDADALLATYTDYRDPAQWPRHADEDAPRNTALTPLTDPRERPGHVGAFCRAYDIHEAIAAYLPDVYLPTDQPTRYTFSGGTTAGGAVTYDDTWLYSHHDTDPASGRCCNAFDLVRLHRFADTDPRDTAGIAPAELPSYKAMCRLCDADARVRALLVQDTANRAFAEVNAVELPPPDDDADDWRDRLSCNDKNIPYDTIANVQIILEHDPAFRGKLWHDDFADEDRLAGRMPWHGSDENPVRWRNADDAQLRGYLERKYHLRNRERIADALSNVFQAHHRHPVRDWLEGLRWDGKERLDRLIIDYLGADDSDYTRTVTRLHFVAAVARIYQPGVKYDYCLTMTGPEGVGKSSMLAAMFSPWYNDSIDSLDGKGPMEQLLNTWGAELSELSAMNRSEIQRVKQFITSQEDSFRGAYQRRVEKHPRQCVFAATTNETNFLRSDTGDRRFNVVTILPERSKYRTVAERIDAIRADREQLWAEAVAVYRRGCSLYLPDDIAATARRIQAAHNVDAADPMRQILEVYLERLLPADWDTWELDRRRAFYRNPDPLEAAGTVRRTRVCPVEFIREGMRMDYTDGRRELALSKQVTKYLTDLGWRRGTKSRRVERLYGRQVDWTAPGQSC